MKIRKTIVFDLDDTLVKEIDYLKSAFKQIADFVDNDDDDLYNRIFDAYKCGADVFGDLERNYATFSKQELLSIYRNHIPNIELIDGGREILNYCKNKGYRMGLVTDGRSITQRNKIMALDIESYFDLIIVSEELGSEKPCLNNFTPFENFEGEKYYIGDNVSKDFIAPNTLGWNTVCLLDSGENIHKQSFNYPNINLPHFKIARLRDIIEVI